MTFSDWTVRLIPRRSPTFWRGFAVYVLALGVAVALRAIMLGPANAGGLSATYFPAFIAITLYAGPKWGWGAILMVVVLGVITPPKTAGVSPVALMIQFYVSGALTILVSSALRSVVIRLDETQAARDTVKLALGESEARLRIAQEAGSVGLWDWDVVNRRGHWSPVHYRNIGVDVSEPATLRRLLDAAHPDDRDLVERTNLDGVTTGKFDPIEYRVIWPDGSVHWILARGETIRDASGAVVGAVGASIDVTDRRLAFEQMQESEARFRALANSSPVPMWVSKTNGGREFVNQAYVDFLGVSYQEALDFDWRKNIHEGDIQRIMAEQVAGEASRELFTLEARYRRIDGEECWLRSFSQPRYDPTGAFAGFIGVAFDVSETKRAEADLKRINDLMAERVRAALDERDQAAAALNRAQKLEAVGQLTGGVAHDFNNLLTVVIGALDMMQRHPGDAARRERMIEAAMSAARRGERLTQQLLAFARRQALRTELVCIDDLLIEVEPLLRRAVGEAVSLKISPGAPGAVALTDPGQFESAVMNLVVNARDAVPAGGSIRVESRICALAAHEVEEVEPGEYLCVAVHDTGMGMDAATLARSFEPFFTTKEVGKGTGLGLSQVYGFARQTGGGAAIESAPGQGATVRIYLPRSGEALQAAPEAAELQARPSGPALQVLLVEDDPEVGDIVCALLEDLGHAVRRADGVEPALEALRDRTRLDLMITDLIMPGPKTGVDLATEASTLRPGLPVILSSGYTGETLESAIAAPWPLLRKPYSADALAKAIEDAVAKTQQAA